MAVSGLSEYQRSLLATRTRALRRTDRTVERMMGMLGDAASEIMATLDIAPKANWTVRHRVMAGKLDTIQGVLVGLGNEYNQIVGAAVEETIQDVVGTRTRATAALAESNRRVIQRSFTRVPQAALRLYAQRIDAEGLKLSGSLWAKSQMQTIENTIGSAIARGERAGTLARRLEAFLEPAARGGAKRVVHLGDVPVSHKATRLAISEINNTYWETNAIAAHESEVVEAQMWQLSGRHPRTDECDMLSWADGYGLGSGVYPTGRIPSKPHPHCLCYVVDVIREPSQWGRPKPEYGPPDMTRIDRRALADAPKALRDALPGATFTPEQLERAVVGMPRSQRGHITARYAERMGSQFRSGVIGAAEHPIGSRISLREAI